MSTMQQRETALSQQSSADRRAQFLRSRGFVDSVALTVWVRRERSLYIRGTIGAAVAWLFSRLSYWAPAVAIVLVTAIGAANAQQSEPAIVVALDTAAPASDPAAPQARRIFPDVRFLLEDPTIRNHVSPAENAWDFTDSNDMAGFGALPVTQ